MAEADWSLASDILPQESLDRGVTTGITRPPGGGNFLYGFNSLDVVTGASALFVNKTNFTPTPVNKGGSVRGAIKRGLSTGTTNYSPFLFLGLQGPSVNDEAYMLGLADSDPTFLVLKKGRLVDGIPDEVIGTAGVLKRGTETFSDDEWLHIRLDMIVNLNGDVILKVFRNVLSDAQPVTAPVWEAVPGMDDFVDDALSINSGSPPFTQSRFGFGLEVSDTGRRAFFDHIQVFRQL